MAELRPGLVPLEVWAPLYWPELEPHARDARLDTIRQRIAAGTLSDRFWLGVWLDEQLLVATHLDPMGGSEVQVCRVVGNLETAAKTGGLELLFRVVKRDCSGTICSCRRPSRCSAWWTSSTARR